MKNISIFFFVIVFGISGSLMAQTITNIKNKKVLIDLAGESWGAGDKVFTLDGQGKKRALVQIRQVRNGKAVGTILKGAVSRGMSVIMARKAGSSSSSSRSIMRGLRAGSAYGFTGSIMMNSMKVSNFNSNAYGSHSFEMVGTNFGASMFYDYPLTTSWFVRGHGSLEMFDVSKKVNLPYCKSDTSTDCNATFLQTGFYGTFNLIFNPSPYRIWAGAGGGALVYLSKESTVLKTNSFFFNTVLMGAVGMDYFISRNTFIPVTFEYQMIPDKEAAVSSMVIRGGWGKTF